MIPVVIGSAIIAAILVPVLLPAYRSVSWFLRATAILLFAAALLEPTIAGRHGGIHTAYIVDVSASMTSGQVDRAARYIVDTVRDLERTDTAALVLLASQPRIAVRPTGDPEAIEAALHDLSGAGGDSGTDIAAALDLATAVLPATGDRRVILISDGIPTEGDAFAAVDRLRSAGIRLSTALSQPLMPPRDVAVTALEAPAESRRGDRFDLHVTVSSAAAVSALLVVEQNGATIVSERIAPAAGVQRYTYSVTAEGPDRFTATVFAEPDRFAANDAASTIVTVADEPAVLYLSERPGAVATALERQGFTVTVRHPATMRDVLIPLYDLVVLDDVPATTIPLDIQADLERYVRSGGGAIVFAGRRSFGTADYAHTPVESLLPVSLDIASRVHIPTLAILFIVDKSGSMSGGERGVTRLDIVREAVLSSVELLQPNQLVGLLAFDADAEWTIPLQRATEREAIVRDVSRLAPGGGTILELAMNEALTTLEDTTAAAKHVVILSDGLTRDADFGALAQRFADRGITVSTVSIGLQANRELLEEIADRGGGRAYHTEDPRDIPQVFARETSVVARNAAVDESFFPLPGDDTGILAGIDVNRLPALGGYVLTYPRATARQVLNAPQGQPLLAEWRYGLGRAIFFASVIDDSWGSSWTRWAELPRFIGQTARAAARQTTMAGVDIRYRWDDDDLVVGAIGLPEEEVSWTMEGPAGITDGGSPVRTGPDRGEARISAAEPGRYIVTLLSGGETVGRVVVERPYDREYAPATPNPPLLSRLAGAGSGIAVAVDDRGFPAERLPRAPNQSGRRRELWPLLAALGAAVAVLEIILTAIRRSTAYRRTSNS